LEALKYEKCNVLRKLPVEYSECVTKIWKPKNDFAYAKNVLKIKEEFRLQRCDLRDEDIELFLTKFGHK
jgi:hypothetical protein